jgi:uncharacterized protein DUF1844
VATLLLRAFVFSWLTLSCFRSVAPQPLLGRPPFVLELLNREVTHASVFRGERLLHHREPPRELVIRLPERRLGLDPELPCEVGDREEQVPQLVFSADRIAGHLPQFVDLLLNLLDDIVCPGPVEAHRRRARADVIRAQQRGERARNAPEKRLCGRLAGFGSLLRLDLLPSHLHLVRSKERRLTRVALEYVWVPPDQFVRDRIHGIGDAEASGFRLQLRQEDRLEKMIAELLSERVMVGAVDCLDDFVRFLEYERLQRVKALRTIPGTPVGTPQRRHGVDELRKCLACAIGFGHAEHLTEFPPRPSSWRGRRIAARAAARVHLLIGDSSEQMPEHQLTFISFVLSLASTAAIHFGDVPDPTGQTSEPNLDGAAQMIEILALLEEKTKGNLTAEERQLLEQVLYELRMRFVQGAAGEKRIITP